MEKKTQKETQLYLEITLIIQVNKIQTDKNEIVFKRVFRTSGQDGDIVGKWSLPPCTTRRRTTPNLKTKNNPELPEN